MQSMSNDEKVVLSCACEARPIHVPVLRAQWSLSFPNEHTLLAMSEQQMLPQR